jgi:cation:H+ antiporter
MPDAALYILIFVASLAGLVKASDWFIAAAERLGRAMGIPHFIIGVTVVAMGTSLPELVSSIVAVQRGAADVVLGNVVGSNIANIGLVLGLVAIISKQFTISYDLGRVDLTMLVGSALLLYLTTADAVLTLGEAIVLLAGMLIFLIYTVGGSDGEDEKVGEEEREKLRPLDFGILILTAGGIYFCADYNIQSIIKLGEIFNIGRDVIAQTAVALGTSLPELVVSVVAMRRGNLEIVVGNLLGSNIFNTFAVMGIPRLFGELELTQGILDFGMPLMLGVTLLFTYILNDKIVNRWEGLIIMLFYIFYIVQTISMAF